MKKPSPIRLLVADELPYSHGVENVSLALVKEFLDLFERVTWVTARPNRARELEKLFPKSQNLRFASLFAEDTNSQNPRKPSASSGWKSVVKRLPLIGRGARKAHRRRIDDRLRRICRESASTHCFVNYALSQTAPKLDIPVVGLVHDLNFLHYPDNFTPDAPQELRLAIAQWLQDADVVTVLSQAGKEELLSLAPKPPRARVEIIPNAIKDAVEEFANRKPVSGPPTFLYPATALAHKNHLGLLQAANELALNGSDFQVVMTGAKVEEIGRQEPVANATVEKARLYYREHQNLLEEKVSFRIARNAAELSQLYQRAHRVILPTKYEGFGLPLLEAISHGTRVLCSNIAQFHEQVERYGLSAWVDFFDPNEPTSIARAMGNTCLASESPLLLPEVKEKLSQWQWRDSARSYLNLFEELTAKGSQDSVSNPKN